MKALHNPFMGPMEPSDHAPRFICRKGVPHPRLRKHLVVNSMTRDQSREADEALLLDVQRDLADAFQKSLVGRLEEIERLAQAVRTSPMDPQASGRLHICIHGLAGAAAVYGYKDIAQIAREFDLSLVKRFRTGVLTIPLSLLDAFLGSLKQVTAVK